jgi:peptidyl-prolyl cis-trans isomerase D
MAIIQKIRNRAGLLVAIIIGMALIAFILGDFLTSGGIYFSQQRQEIAEVYGKGYSYQLYSKFLNERLEIAKSNSRNGTLDEQNRNAVELQAWKDFISEKVMAREYKRLGIEVHDDELIDMITGDQPHYIVQQIFSDQTGRLNRDRLNGFLSTLSQIESDDPQKKMWKYYEDIIYTSRKMVKYQNFIRQGLYATSVEANKQSQTFNKTVDFNYVVKRFSEISDSSVVVSESDLKKYYNENIEKYTQQESRDLRYMVWEVLPSDEDYEDVKSWINNEYKGLVNEPVETTMQYVKSISDISPNFSRVTKEELNAPIDSFAFNAEIGDVYGPYFENEAYKLAKLTDIIYIPDSVKVSHIFFNITEENYANLQQIRAKADSIVKVLNNGEARFTDMVNKFSEDFITKANNGDLGWIKEGYNGEVFSDTCFLGEKGDIKLTFSDKGIHIVKINNTKGSSKQVKVAVMAREVRPSEKTDQRFYSMAREFGVKNNTSTKFDEAVKTNPSNLRYESNISANKQRIGNIEDSRELIRWAFAAKEGDVTDKVYQFGNKYIVAILDKARKEGYASLSEVESTVKNEIIKQKKAEKIVEEINQYLPSTQGLSDLATNLKTDVRSSSNIRFNNSMIAGIGEEPKLIGAATSLDEGAISETIIGANGVYVIEVTGIQENENAQITSYDKINIERGYSRRLNMPGIGGNTQLMDALNKLAKVEDNRVKFY